MTVGISTVSPGVVWTVQVGWHGTAVAAVAVVGDCEWHCADPLDPFRLAEFSQAQL